MQASSGVLPVQSSHIWEDSAILKSLCCVPVIGIIPGIIIERSINRQLRQASAVDSAKLIKLIDIKNDYHACGLVRDILFTAAVIVTRIALGVLPRHIIFIPVLTLFAIGLTALRVYVLHHNQKIINSLEQGNAYKGQYIM